MNKSLLSSKSEMVPRLRANLDKKQDNSKKMMSSLCWEEKFLFTRKIELRIRYGWYSNAPVEIHSHSKMSLKQFYLTIRSKNGFLKIRTLKNNDL